MNPESYNQGAKDVFLAKIRADFDAVENQALKSFSIYEQYSLIGTDPSAMTLFTNISDVSDDGSRAVWRHVGTTGVQSQGKRSAGGTYPQATFIRNYETVVLDPDEQDANEFTVPEEREMAEGRQYKNVLNRAQKILTKMDRTNIADPFEVFNYAFTAPSSYPTRLFARGNNGLDGNNTSLGERLVSIQHARADGGTTQSNAVQSAGNARAFGVDAYWAAREQGATLKDDVGEPMPLFGGMVTIVVPPANGLVRSAVEINGSTFEPGNANNQINVQKGQLGRMISSPDLLVANYDATISNTSQWFIVDETGRDPEVGTGLISISFVPMQTRVERDSATDSVKYKIKQTKLYGFVDWRNILGSKGNGAAYSA